MATRSKVIWGHARGNLNLGVSSIPNGAMPSILAWFGNDSNATNTNLIQHHKRTLPKAKIDTIRLDSIYRILRSRPELCHKRKLVIEKVLPKHLEARLKGLMHCRSDAKRRADQIN